MEIKITNQNKNIPMNGIGKMNFLLLSSLRGIRFVIARMIALKPPRIPQIKIIVRAVIDQVLIELLYDSPIDV